MNETPEKFEGWAIVELMGHQRVAGRVTEQVIAGANLLRVDIPKGPTDADGYYTRFFSSSALYCLNVVSEEIARKACGRFGFEAPFAYLGESTSRLPRLASPEGEFGDD